MKYYAVAEIEITDPSWVRDYVAEVTPMVERHGGRYLARTGQVDQLDGARAGARNEFRLVAGEDVTGAARVA